MRAPAFWYQPNSFLTWLLAPLGWVYDAMGKFLRARVTPEKIGIPVVCVGGITLGGSGKTPVVAELGKRLRAAGIDAHILSRGYGGKAKGPLRVDSAQHQAQEVGDEPLLLANYAPVWIAKNKVQGAKAAAKAGAKLLLLDDGFQNPSLHKDFSFLVMDAAAGLGNNHVFPAGPLREKLEDALLRTDAVICIGDEPPPPALARTRKTFLRAVATPLPPQELRGKKVLAFCGLGRPQKFFDSLTALEAHLVTPYAFPDHHPYTRADIENILKQAEGLAALPLTTEKDAMRLPADLQPRIAVCGLRMVWQDETSFEKTLRDLHGLLR